MPKRDEIGREREKKFYSRIPFMLDPGKKIQKTNGKKIEKIKKTSFRYYFLPKWDDIGRERGKQILHPNAVRPRPGQENSEKHSKKIEKIEKPLSDIIFSQNGMR